MAANQHHATIPQLVAIHERLKEVYDAEDGRYRDGWNDRALAKAIDPTLSYASVSRVRIQLYGLMRKSEKVEKVRSDVDKCINDLADAMGHLINRVQSLEGASKVLTEHLGAFQLRLAALEAALTAPAMPFLDGKVHNVGDKHL
jgi:hypothetical protein